MLSKSYSEAIESLNPVVLSGLYGSSASKLVVQEHSNSTECSLVICKDNSHAEEFISQLKFFSGMSDNDIIFFPELEILPYDNESPNSTLISKRISAVQKLVDGNLSGKIIVATSFSASNYMMPFSYWKENTKLISKGSNINQEEFVTTLKEFGYKSSETRVEHHSEFIVHNNIVDVKSSSVDENIGYRLTFSSGELKKITSFDTYTQNTLFEVDDFKLSPAFEVPLDAEGKKTFRQEFRKTFQTISDPIYASMSKGVRPAGIEFFISLFKTNETLLSFLPSFNLFFFESSVESLEKKVNYFNTRYQELTSIGRNLLPPEKVISSFLSKDKLKKKKSISLISTTLPGKDCGYSDNCILPKHSISEMLAMLSAVASQSNKVVFSATNEDRASQILKLSMMLKSPAQMVNTWQEAIQSSSKIAIVKAVISEGFKSISDSVTLITEKEMFGLPIKISDSGDHQVIDQKSSELLQNVKKGDLVIHQKYGIARFRGFKKHSLNIDSAEFLALEFADDSTIYLSLSEIANINRYDHLNPDEVKLDKYDPSGSKWKRELDEAFEGISKTAYTLIDYQIKKQKAIGIAIPEPSADYSRFCKEFPYEATRDQLLTVSEIQEDLTSPRPMDRLVSGDVGFGKTEIAQRASMICASSGFQVVIVAPTTLLCHQHYLSFKERFKDFNIPICELSSSIEDENAIFNGIANGDYKIIVATHKAFSNKLKPKNLGLVIIDEEHRFGVKQKEKIRSMFPGVNFMSMTATPIPRTLKASLSGIKDTSVLSTPPAARLSIITKVSKFEPSLIKEAIEREMIRDGQVFFVHNNVGTILDRANYIRALVPDVRVGVIHGKMHDMDIERVMSMFYNKQFDVLVATTVIETGIDVPNSNTIIIESANNFGLASLHQLRGRVGRAKRQGYCFLLKSGDTISEIAEKRLKAMEEASSLGEGYRLANYDLEIRGAGDVLGEEQSGHISKLGFDTYQKILDKCVSILKKNPSIKPESLYEMVSANDVDKTMIDAGISGEIPDSYISDDSTRLFYYKAISLAENSEELMRIQHELEDRFGDIPSPLATLLNVSRLRVNASYLKLASVKVEDGNLVFSFEKGLSNSDPIMKIYMKDPDHAEIKSSKGGNQIIVPQVSGGTEEKLKQLEELLA